MIRIGKHTLTESPTSSHHVLPFPLSRGGAVHGYYTTAALIVIVIILFRPVPRQERKLLLRDNNKGLADECLLVWELLIVINVCFLLRDRLLRV